jgi:hypothetical protein
MIWLDAVALEDFLQNYLWLVDENGESVQKPKYMEQLVSLSLMRYEDGHSNFWQCKERYLPALPVALNLDHKFVK